MKKNRKPKHKYCWVIKTKDKRPFLIGDRYWYFAGRTAVNNPQYLTPFHWKVKYFNTRSEADYYLHLKALALRSQDWSKFEIIRIKIHLKNGRFDFFKNAEAFDGRK